MIKKAVITLWALFLAGCYSKANVGSIKTNVSEICIVNNGDVIVPNFIITVIKILQQNNINAYLLESPEKAKKCQIMMLYTASLGWTTEAYISDADLYLFDGKNKNHQIGYVYYIADHQTDENATSEKLVPKLIDELLGKKE